MHLIAMLLLAAAPKLTDAQLMAKMHKVNLDEINAGKLGEKNCQSQDCKDYAQMLVRDHESADTTLKATAKQAHVDMNRELPKAELEKEHVMHAKMEQLKGMHGAEFDRAWGEVMKNGHADVISMLKDAKGDVKSDGLKQWIDNQMSVLNTHEDRAKALASGKAASRNDKAQGRTPATEMHRSDNLDQDHSDRRDMPNDTSERNAEGTDKR